MADQEQLKLQEAYCSEVWGGYYISIILYKVVLTSTKRNGEVGYIRKVNPAIKGIQKIISKIDKEKVIQYIFK